MHDHSKLGKKDNDGETAGLVSEEGHHHESSGAERLHNMKSISKLITEVSSTKIIKNIY